MNAQIADFMIATSTALVMNALIVVTLGLMMKMTKMIGSHYCFSTYAIIIYLKINNLILLIMKNKLLIVVTFFLIVHHAYSQHIASVIRVDIPLNTSKETAVKKLLNQGYEFYDSREEDGYRILQYKRKYIDYAANYGYYEYNRRVSLYCSNGKVSRVSWGLLGEKTDILSELKNVYDLVPYAEVNMPFSYSKNGTSYSTESYFHWKGNTLIVNTDELLILSNADAENKYQIKIQEIERQEQNRIKLENEKIERERQRLEEKRRQEQERLERTRREEARRKREADSIAHIQKLKEDYSSCRFLFETVDKNYISDEDFVSCITQESQKAIEDEIMSLIHLKMNEISTIVVKGTEFKDQYRAKSEMDRICNIPNHMRNVSPAIANFTEDKIIEFVTNRKKLNNAYNRAKRKNPDVKCSEFLQTYINEKQW